MAITFEWDEDKARQNVVKHGVSFDEAASAFLDPSGLLNADPAHSINGEDRAALLGYSQALRLLVVVHVEYADEVIRLISARRANRREQEEYHARFS